MQSPAGATPCLMCVAVAFPLLARLQSGTHLSAPGLTDRPSSFANRRALQIGASWQNSFFGMVCDLADLRSCEAATAWGRRHVTAYGGQRAALPPACSSKRSQSHVPSGSWPAVFLSGERCACCKSALVAQRHQPTGNSARHCESFRPCKALMPFMRTNEGGGQCRLLQVHLSF